MPSKDAAERRGEQTNGGKYAKGVTKSRQRRRERDLDHDLARRLRDGIRGWEAEDEE